MHSKERIDELQRIVTRGMTDSTGKFQHYYKPEEVEKAQKALDDLKKTSTEATEITKTATTTSKDSIFKSLGLDKTGKPVDRGPMTLKEMAEKIGKPLGVSADQGASTTPTKPSPYVNEESLALMKAKEQEKLKAGDITGAKVYHDSVARLSDTLKAQKLEEIKQKREELAEKDKAKTEPPKTEPAPEPKKEPEPPKKEEPVKEEAGKASISDLKDLLVQLNTNVKELITHTDRVADGVAKQIKAVTGSRI